MIKKTFYYLSAIIFVGAFIYFRLAPEKSEEIINSLTTDSESVEQKLIEPTQQVVQSLSKHGITIDEQRWGDEPPVFRVKATNRGETCMLELQAVISLKDGTSNTITLHNEGDDFYNGQTTWFDGLVTDDLSDISSIQVFSFDIY
jgi:(2Fe-2S) ferredoxin